MKHSYRWMDAFTGKGLKKRRRDDDHTGLSTILAGFVAYSEEADAKRRILEAELEEKRREQERKHEERMMQMMMTFMHQMMSNNARIPLLLHNLTSPIIRPTVIHPIISFLFPTTLRQWRKLVIIYSWFFVLYSNCLYTNFFLHKYKWSTIVLRYIMKHWSGRKMFCNCIGTVCPINNMDCIRVG